MDKTQTLIPKPPFLAVQLQVELQRADIELHLGGGGGNEVIFHFQMRISTLGASGAHLASLSPRGTGRAVLYSEVL